MSMLTYGMGDDGSGLEVTIVANPVKTKVKVKEHETVRISTQLNTVEVSTKNMKVGTDLSVDAIKTKVKDC